MCQPSSLKRLNLFLSYKTFSNSIYIVDTVNTSMKLSLVLVSTKAVVVQYITTNTPPSFHLISLFSFSFALHFFIYFFYSKLHLVTVPLKVCNQPGEKVVRWSYYRNVGRCCECKRSCNESCWRKEKVVSRNASLARDISSNRFNL